MMDKRILIGRLGKPFGIHGQMHLHSFCIPADNILNYNNIIIKHQKEWISPTVHHIKQHGNSFIIHFNQISTPEEAKAFTNDDVAILSEDLPDLAQDEYYWNQLIGLEVVTTDNLTLGKVTGLLDTGANDVLIIEAPGQRHLVPYRDEVLKKIDLAKGCITVDWDPDF